LGSTNVICSDKTGTLTENTMTVESIWAGGHRYDLPDGLPEPDELGTHEALRLTLMAGVLANEAQLVETPDRTSSTGDPTEVALLISAVTAGLDPTDLRRRHATVHEIPFEPDLRYSASTRDLGTSRAIFVKGAPEKVIGMCASVLTPDGPEPIDPGAVHEIARELGERGLRVLAMAYRQLDDREGGAPEGPDDPDRLVLVGMQAMMDPPRKSVREAIASCHDAGLRVIMITGDHADTARAIGVRLGIVATADAPVLTGAELAETDDRELGRLVRDVSVFARVSPNDKLRIVRALQEQGQVVAVTGDGVNDAPALR